MTEMAPRTSGSHIGGTIVAFIIAPVVLIITAGLSGALWFFLNNILTIISPEILSFMGAMFGGYVGTYCAKSACDAVLRGYSEKAVFVEIFALISLVIIFEMTLPFGWARVSPIAQAILIIWLSWILFWKGDSL